MNFRCGQRNCVVCGPDPKEKLKLSDLESDLVEVFECEHRDMSLSIPPTGDIIMRVELAFLATVDLLALNKVVQKYKSEITGVTLVPGELDDQYIDIALVRNSINLNA